MYFWKIKPLKDDINNDTLTHKDNFLYLTLYIAVTALLLTVTIIQLYKIWGVGMVLAQLFVVIAGTYYAFHLNGGMKGKNFKKRFFSLAWIFLVRSLFFMMIGMLNLVVMTTLFGIEKMFTAQNSMIIGLLFEILLYWRIGKHIQSLSKN